MISRSRISAAAVELPAESISTEEVQVRARLGERFGVEDGWLERITGVRERRWAGAEVKPSDLASAAALRLCENFEIDQRSFDVVIFCGITRDFVEPATAAVVAAKIGAASARVFDIMNACNGVIDGLDVADSLIRLGRARRVLVATGERASIAIDWHPDSFEELLQSVAAFVIGDGGGAMILEPSEDVDRGIVARSFRSEAQHWQLAIGGKFLATTDSCPSCGRFIDHRFKCDGKQVFRVGMEMMVPTIIDLFEQTTWAPRDLDILFCHEASKLFLDRGQQAFKGSDLDLVAKLWTTVERYGNTSTVSLPLQVSEAMAEHALVPGTRTFLMSGGAGFSTAGLAVVW